MSDFVPNDNAVAETVEHMLNRCLPGGGKRTIDDACWWAWEHAFSHDMSSNQHKFWRAVYAALDAKRRK